MSNAFRARPLKRLDMPAVKHVIESSGLFPSEMLDSMAAPYLNGGGGEEIWCVAEEDSEPVGVAYCAPERMTSGTWNLLLIAIHASYQRRGLGRSLMLHVEKLLEARGERLLLVETSGLFQFEPVRRFYRNMGYAEEARIRDYYQRGEDKIVFRKALGAVEQ